MINRPGENIYDQVPYPSYSFTQSHPDRLATIATLLGMSPASVRRCRVLELGCASGGNLLPMAQSLPESHFVGVDSSARQIEEGRTAIRKLGLKNVTLEQMDILDVGTGLDQFDYIIAHGVYSWVPPEVRDKMLEICRQHLAPHGVAYISYNIYPGWHILKTIREMLLYHTRQVTDPQQQVAESREFLDFLARWIPNREDSFAGLLHHSVEFVRERMIPKTDAYLLHDELSEVNEPIYFYQFAEHIIRHGLRYMADAQFQTMLASNLPPELAEALRHMVQDTVSLEQYIDFVRNRSFRQSLLCHQNVALSARLKPERLADFYVASSAAPESSPVDFESGEVDKFRGSDGAILSTDHPLTKAAMLFLNEIWPQAVSFEALLDAARHRLNGAAETGQTGLDEAAQMLGLNLVKAYGYSDSLVELHAFAPHFVREVSERPVASPVARLQAQTQNGGRVTNLWHQLVHLDEVSYRLLSCLDGSLDRPDLLAMVEEWVAAGALKLKEDDQVVEDEERIERMLKELLDSKLGQLARAALLVA